MIRYRRSLPLPVARLYGVSTGSYALRRGCVRRGVFGVFAILRVSIVYGYGYIYSEGDMGAL